MFKVKFGQLIIRKIIKVVASMSDFEAEMHQIRFRLGLHSPSNTAALLRPLDGFKEALGEWRKKERAWRGKGKGARWDGPRIFRSKLRPGWKSGVAIQKSGTCGTCFFSRHQLPCAKSAVSFPKFLDSDLCSRVSSTILLPVHARIDAGGRNIIVRLWDERPGDEYSSRNIGLPR